ncbi:MAG: hypothetical protein HY859_13340 [Caulobacterales bacterium]|nr:hypothetical protein [Caulobacterales bacterium]
MQTATIFNLETVPLDGEMFADCEFRECRMVYSGGKPPVFDNCRFDACDWRFDDAAARTLAHLKVVWAAGGKAQVQALIKEITVSSGGR